MATTKETMRVITMGIGNHEDEDQEVCREECTVVEDLAYKAAENFIDMTEYMEDDKLCELVAKLEEAAQDNPGDMVDLLVRMFERNDMDAAAAEVKVIDLCADRNPDAYDIFADAFLDSDYVDWYCVENWITDMFPSKDQDLLKEDDD